MKQEKIFSRINPEILTHLILFSGSRASDDFNDNPPRNDLIEAENSLQASWIQMTEGQSFLPHVHDNRTFGERISNTQECWVVVDGKIEASLFDLDTELICKRELNVGDFVFTLKGGHNYMCISATAQVCEIKSGPYDIQNDKRRFQTLGQAIEVSYNPWPIGQVNPEFHRPELTKLRENGYEYQDAREIIGIFERKLADFAGSKYAVVMDCASNAIFLSLKYKRITGEVTIPRNTYISVPMQIMHAGCRVRFEDVSWSGVYELGLTGIFDGAARFTKNMFVGGEDSLQVLSFQIKKRLPIGRGGAILTDSIQAYEWLKLASYDGRDLNSPYDSPEHVKSLGWHMYMTPEDAARGILIFDMLGTGEFPDIAGSESYPNIEPWIRSILASEEQRNGAVR